MSRSKCFGIGVLTAAMACATGTMTLAAPAAAPQTKPVDPAVEAARAELAALRPELERSYAALEAKARAMPRDAFDPQAILERVGRDPAALTAWVGAETDLLPYRGALRGARGVLMDRAGNSLDRALLLAELLRAAGNEVRLANAALQPAAAQALAGKVGATRAKYPQSEITDDGKAARERVARHTADLLKAIAAPSGAADAKAVFAESLADHWWVQRNENGKWVDHDPAGVAPLPAAARNVAAPANAYAPLTLDAKDCHEVTLRLFIEAYKGGKLASEMVMEHTLRPAEVLDRPLALSHQSNKLSDLKPPSKPADVDALLRKTLVEETTYLPVLSVGPASLMSASFNTAGEVDRSPKVDKLGKLGGTVTDVFGGGLTGGGGDGAPKADVLTAEWVEYTIAAPGRPPVTVRRMVFDLIGPAARASGLKAAPTFAEADKLRRGLMLIGETRVFLQPCELSQAFAGYQMTRATLDGRGAWLRLVNGEFGDEQAVFRALGSLKPEVDFARLVAMARGPAAGATAAATFIDRPNVIAHRTWFEAGADGAVEPRQGIDLAFTSTAALAGAEGAPQAFAARVAQGVADTFAEQVGASDRPQVPENALPLFERAIEQKASPVVARAASDLAALSLPADTRARAEADIAAGHVLVVAKLDTGRAGWWRVDPRNGQTVGVMDNGYHANTSEYPPTVQAGPARAGIMFKRVNDANRFKNLTPREYMKLTRDKTLTMEEWNAVEVLQGKIAPRVYSLAEQLAKARYGGPV